jgi:hypothetical protein
MELKSEKKQEGEIHYTEYFYGCGKCGKEGVDVKSARMTANSFRTGKRKSNSELRM